VRRVTFAYPARSPRPGTTACSSPAVPTTAGAARRGGLPEWVVGNEGGLGYLRHRMPNGVKRPVPSPRMSPDELITRGDDIAWPCGAYSHLDAVGASSDIATIAR